MLADGWKWGQVHYFLRGRPGFLNVDSKPNFLAHSVRQDRQLKSLPHHQSCVGRQKLETNVLDKIISARTFTTQPQSKGYKKQVDNNVCFAAHALRGKTPVLRETNCDEYSHTTWGAFGVQCWSW